MMNNDMSNPTNHNARISCEEFYTEDMGPATWANEAETPRERFEREVGSDDHLDTPQYAGRCEDAPCCGCCPSSNDYAADDGYGANAADAWHDAHEYPAW